MTLRLLVLPALLATAAAIADPAEPAPAPPPASVPAMAAPSQLAGRLEAGRYHAPGDAYSVTVPVLRGAETAIMDNGEIAVFKDKVSTLLTIADFPLPPFAKWEHETTPPRDYLIAFFRDNILRDYSREFPGSSIESARFIPDFQGGALVAFTLLPGGSAFAAPTPRPPTAPAPVAKRGHIVFVRNDRVFVIATELAERVTRGPEFTLPTTDEDRILFDRLIAVLATTRFGPGEEPSGVVAQDESEK